MSNAVVIVESPTKVKTIKKFLGDDYQVMACMGHVRGLPSRTGSVDVTNNFTPHYEVLPQSAKHLEQIRKAVSHCQELFLATDLDREGEAIAWHLVEALDLAGGKKKRIPDIKRITFHEITEQAIEEAMKHPRKISLCLVDAQQARAILDYLYGFNLSPFLWRKVRSRLSAGRVQSPALRLICERELEIQAFKEEEYWTITAALSTAAPPSPENTFKAQLFEVGGKKLDRLGIHDQSQADAILTALKGASYQVKKVQKTERKENPPPPFITSTLQQEASTKLGFSAKKTMTIAQRLYEGIEIGGESEGLITYMRTDSYHIAAPAIESMRQAIESLFGADYVHKTIRRFKQQSKTAQEAHEAIRPTDVFRTPDTLKGHLNPDQYKLYELIWRRTLAGQMAQSVEDRVSVDIMGGPEHLFRAHGATITFPGYRKALLAGKDTGTEEKDDNLLPPLAKNQELELAELIPQQHFTKPPPRFTEASLVKALEEYGIGRPSTYASIISVLQEREYVRLENRRFLPQEIGMIVHKLLKEHFSRYVDYQFTARVEEELDEVAQGKTGWKPVVQDFWEPFIQLIKVKNTEVKKSDIVNEPTDELCPQCGQPMVIRLGPYGRFMACSGYPKCRYLKPLNGDQPAGEESGKTTEEVCALCGRPMMMRKGRFGTFLGCSGYPECKHTKPLAAGPEKEVKTSDEKCEQCGALLVIRKNRFGKFFLACPNYPKCTYATSLKKKPTEA